jgi:hypothetical protein
MTKTITTTLTALALVAAALTTTTALSGTASAKELLGGSINNPAEPEPTGTNIPGHPIPKPGTGGASKPTGATGGIISKLPTGGTVVGEPKPIQLPPPGLPPLPKPTGLGGSIQPVQACFAGEPCNLPPKPTPVGGTGIQPVQACFAGQPCILPPKPTPTPVPPHPPICPLDGHCDGPPRGPSGGEANGGHHGGGDGDGDGRGHGYGYGYGYGERERTEVVIEGAPAAVAVPVQTVVPARVPAAAQPVAQEPCSCLTKQTLQDGSVLFQDVCTKQSALAPAPTAAVQ